MHDATKVLMGGTQSSDREVTREEGDPLDFPAGRAVRRTTGEALSLTAGALIGVSVGADLSDIEKTAVVRAGNFVPLELARYLVKADLTLISKVSVLMTIVFTDTVTAGSEAGSFVVEADGSVTLTLAIQGGVSTATQCKTALDADLGAYLETQIAAGQGAVGQAAFAVDDIDSIAQAVIGQPVLLSILSGMAIPTGGFATGALYQSAALTGVVPALDLSAEPTNIDAATIDMGGGL